MFVPIGGIENAVNCGIVAKYSLVLSMLSHCSAWVLKFALLLQCCCLWMTRYHLLCRSSEVGAVWSHSHNQQLKFRTSSIGASCISVHGRNTQAVGHEWWRQHDKNVENQLHSILWLPLVPWCKCTCNCWQLSFSQYYRLLLHWSSAEL